MFIRPHDEHGASGMANNALGGAAHEGVLQPGVAVRGNDDQVDVQRLRGGRNFVKGTTMTHENFIDDRGVEAVLGGDALKAPFAMRVDGFVVERERERTVKIGRRYRFHDMEERDLRTELAREGGSVNQRFGRGVREISWDENGSEFDLLRQSGRAHRNRLGRLGTSRLRR